MIRAIVVLVLVLPSIARAQATRVDMIGAASTEPNAVELRVGADDAFVAEVAYARALRVAGVRVVVGGQLDVPWAELDASDWRVRIGVAVPISVSSRWLVIPRIAPTVRGSANDTASLVGLGVDVSAAAGYFAPRWFASLEGGLDAELATRVAPTSAYQMHVYDRAETGWYSTPGGALRYGVVVGATRSANDFALRAGKLVMTDGDSPTLPFYALLSYARRW